MRDEETGGWNKPEEGISMKNAIFRDVTPCGSYKN
jgi:hypothetical protein